jgi:hypothetical protein
MGIFLLPGSRPSWQVPISQLPFTEQTPATACRPGAPVLSAHNLAPLIQPRGGMYRKLPFLQILYSWVTSLLVRTSLKTLFPEVFPLYCYVWSTVLSWQIALQPNVLSKCQVWNEKQCNFQGYECEDNILVLNLNKCLENERIASAVLGVYYCSYLQNADRTVEFSLTNWLLIRFFHSSDLPACLSIYLPVAPTWSIGDSWNASFHFSFCLRQSVGLLGRGISSSQGRCLQRTKQTQNKRPCLEWDSNSWSQRSSRWRHFMP